METLLLDILDEIRAAGQLDDKSLSKIIRRHNKNLGSNDRPYSKKRILPFYLKVKDTDPERWTRWNINETCEKLLIETLQVKPRRTSSGVATITVITKPWKCSSDCLYCPNDVRMPKSYLSDEPACQRAERNYFDPYLQVASRLRALTHMGHVTDKIELIVLGGTWSDYSEAYQTWFITELFRALNDGEDIEDRAATRRKFYKNSGLKNQEDELALQTESMQAEVNAGTLSYNQAIDRLYKDDAWEKVAQMQTADMDKLAQQHEVNETAKHRVVGLVIETRPDMITAKNLELLRRLGCTKIQMGIQSLNPEVLEANHRYISVNKIRESFELLRIFGFKIHAHFMVNLYKTTPEADKKDYRLFVTDPAYLPDEVKLYPCVLVNGTKLCAHFEDKTWRPYTEEELLDILTTDTIITPPYVRISRMIRDISAHDIVAGNKKANLRQLVEGEIEKSSDDIVEIRYREIKANTADIGELRLEIFPYKTTATNEYFLQWVSPENQIAGFLRLSLPKPEYVQQNEAILPVGLGEAMIREVHVYGKVAGISGGGENAQHLGLGRKLIKEACDIAREQGFIKMNVISSVGTREYYRSLGFRDKDLYQQVELV